MERFLVVSSVLSLVSGFLLRSYERKRHGGVVPNPKRLTAIQVAYSVLLAYPFCVLYVWVDRRFGG